MKRTAELYDDYCDALGLSTTKYTKENMIDFAEFVKESSEIPRPTFPERSVIKTTWQEDFVKAFAFIGLILFVFGVLFLIVKAWQ